MGINNLSKHDLVIKAAVEVNVRRLWTSLSRQLWNDCYFKGKMKKECLDGPMFCPSKTEVTKLWVETARWN